MRTRAYRTAFPDLTVTGDGWRLEGDRAAERTNAKGVTQVPSRVAQRLVACGAPPCAAMFQLVDHQIIHGWITRDLLSISGPTRGR